MGVRPDHAEVDHDCAYRIQAPAPVKAHEQMLRDFENGDTLMLVRTLDHWSALYERPASGYGERPERVLAFGPTPDDALVALAQRIAARLPA